MRHVGIVLFWRIDDGLGQSRHRAVNLDSSDQWEQAQIPGLARQVLVDFAFGNLRPQREDIGAVDIVVEIERIMYDPTGKAAPRSWSDTRYEHGQTEPDSDEDTE